MAELDRKVYRSPSGGVTLSVDPGRRNGGGSASYRLTRGANELWSGERPWTLWDAVVTDEGVVAGYAYGAGIGGGAGDALTIVIVGPDGHPRLEERHSRSGVSSCTSSPDSFVTGLLLDAVGDRLILRIRGDEPWTTPESWYAFALADGSPEPVFDPGAVLETDPRRGWIREACVVPESGLVLARWQVSDHRRHERGALFALYEPDGRLVWRLDWPTDHSYVGEAGYTEEEIEEQGVILATGPRSFTLRQVATDERVTFRLERSSRPGAAWVVREVERQPWVRPEVPPDAPELSLAHLGTIQLAVDDSSEPRPHFGRVVLGPGDRIHAFEQSSAAVLVFRPDGSLERVLRPEPEDFDGKELRLFSSLSVSGTGEVLLRNLRFAADGSRIGKLPLESKTFGPRLQAQPGSGLLWVEKYDSVELARLDGQVLRRIERTPSGQWLRGISALGVAPDGSLALVTTEVLGGQGIPGIHLYSPEGDPLRSLPPPSGMSPGISIAFDGQRLVIGALRDGEPPSVVLLDTAGRVHGYFTPPGSAPRWTPFFAASGTELWLHDGKGTIERYRCP